MDVDEDSDQYFDLRPCWMALLDSLAWAFKGGFCNLAQICTVMLPEKSFASIFLTASELFPCK